MSAPDELPQILQMLVRLHKREVFNLFRRWEMDGLELIPMDVFAENVETITDSKLSDADLLALLNVVEPVRGDEMLVGERWQSRPLECKRLWRILSTYAGQASSRYIRESISASRSPTLVTQSQSQRN